MRVAVCNTQVPFTEGGGEAHGRQLTAALRRHGVEAELVELPFRSFPVRHLARQMLAWRLVDVTEAAGLRIDRVIALRFPSYLVNHPDKVAWVVHQHRSAYDLWGHPLGDLSGTEEGDRLREMIRTADAAALRSARRVHANSKTVASRLQRYNGVASEPLYHPPPDAERIRRGPFGDYVLCPGRLEPIKRQEVLLEAMALTRSGGRCILAGTGAHEAALRRLVAERGLEGRVVLAGHVGRDELLALYAGARAVFYGPFDEDYGYVTLEAFLSAKPVLTLADSGGPLEFVEDGENGFVLPADPREIAQAIDALMEDPARAARLGRRGEETVRAMNLSWDRVVETLLA